MSYGPSDVIEFKDLNTGGNAAGNGGNGYNHGNLENSQTAKFSPHNKAVGAEVDVKNGDDVKQKASSDGGDANGGKAKVYQELAKAKEYQHDKKEGHEKEVDIKKAYDLHGKASADGGQTTTKTLQSSESGHNQSKVSADTTAYQTNSAKIDQYANLIAGNGGDGGSHNTAKGGDVAFALVHSNPSTDLKYTEIKYTVLKEVPHHSDHYSADDFLHG